MQPPSQRLQDLALAVFGVAVISTAGYAVLHQPSPPREAATTSASPSPSTQPSATQAATAAGPVLLIGKDLSGIKDALASKLNADVVAIDGSVDPLIPTDALSKVTITPTEVLVQVLAGTSTADRINAALGAIRAAYPDADITVVGPLTAADHLTTEAARAATGTAGVRFIDPVAAGWDITKTGEVADHVAGDLTR